MSQGYKHSHTSPEIFRRMFLMDVEIKINVFSQLFSVLVFA